MNGEKRMANTLFATRIKNLRTEKGLTMDKLASELGIRKSRISMWENNGTVPRRETLLQLADYFHVSTDYLLGHEMADPEDTEEKQLQYLQRGLSSLNKADLDKAEKLLCAVFGEIFKTEEDDDGV